MANPQNLTGKGFSENPDAINRKGAPKGPRRRTILTGLLNDIRYVYAKKGLTPLMREMIEDIYSSSEVELAINSNQLKHCSVESLYFFESSFGIKIGKSKKVAARLYTIQKEARSIVSPLEKVSLIKEIPFGGAFEKDVHREFDDIRIKVNSGMGTEWFKPVSDLRAFISEIKSHRCLIQRYTDASIPPLNQLALFN